MIITKEMFDEFVESAENQNILWTDTLALIGVTVGDVPDVDDDALDFGNEVIAACSGLVHQPSGTVGVFSIMWDGIPYDVAIKAQETQP